MKRKSLYVLSIALISIMSFNMLFISKTNNSDLLLENIEALSDSKYDRTFSNVTCTVVEAYHNGELIINITLHCSGGGTKSCEC